MKIQWSLFTKFKILLKNEFENLKITTFSLLKASIINKVQNGISDKNN